MLEVFISLQFCYAFPKYKIHKDRNSFRSPHCVRSVRIWSFSGPYFPAFGLNTDQKNSEYEHFSRSASNLEAYSDPSQTSDRVFGKNS